LHDALPIYFLHAVSHLLSMAVWLRPVNCMVRVTKNLDPLDSIAEAFEGVPEWRLNVEPRGGDFRRRSPQPRGRKRKHPRQRLALCDRVPWVVVEDARSLPTSFGPRVLALRRPVDCA